MRTNTKFKSLKYESKLLDGGSVKSSMELHKFDYIDGDCICRYIDDEGDEYTIRRSDGDMFCLATSDWVHWIED